MHRSLKVFGVFLFLSLTAAASSVESHTLPSRFEPNRGQAPEAIRFLAHGLTHRVALTSSAIQIQVRNQDQSATAEVRLIGASPQRMEGIDALPGRTNYLIGSHSEWKTGVPNYARVRYTRVWPGVDAVFYDNQGRLEYDFIVAPGVNPDQIRLGINAKGVSLDPDGSLRIATVAGDLRQHPPVAYQTSGAKRLPVDAHYLLADGKLQFALGDYDRSLPLVIDPVLDYGTVIGGSGFDQAVAIAIDPDNNTYIAGITGSSNLPATFGAFQFSFGGGDRDAFVAKLDPNGNRVFTTYLGGSGREFALGIAVGEDRSIYVTGFTSSGSFPITAGAARPSYGGGDSDCFLVRLRPDGASPMFSTFLGGGGEDSCTAIALGPDGSPYVVGETTSNPFPVTPGALSENYRGGGRDGFVTRMSPSGATILFSSYLGGSNSDAAYGIDVGRDGRSCITGYTGSSNFPTTSDAFLTSHRGGDRDAFLTILNSAGRALVYSTFLGGSDNDTGNGVKFDGSGNCYAVGETKSENFAVFGRPLQNAYAGGNNDAWVAAVNPLNTIIYSTYLGGESTDQGLAIAVDSGGNAVVTGSTTSNRFPVARPIQANRRDARDVFISTLSPDGSSLLDSTYYGAGDNDQGRALAIDTSGRIYVAGETRSSDFPRSTGDFRGDTDAFILRIRDTSLFRNLAVLNAGSFAGNSIAPGSIASLFSSNLTTQTESASTLPLPSTLAGIRVTLRDASGFDYTLPLFFASPGQVNFLVPDTVRPGVAQVQIRRDNVTIASGNIEISREAPALFTANSSGSGAPAARVVTRTASGQLVSYFAFQGSAVGSFTPAPISLGGPQDVTVVELFGTGIPAGATVTAEVGGTPVPVLFSGPQGQFAGLHQVNISLPNSLAGRGQVDVRIFANSVPSNTVQLLIQ